MQKIKDILGLLKIIKDVICFVHATDTENRWALKLYSRSCSPLLRMAAAKNKQAEVSILALIGQDTEPLARAIAAAHPKTPISTLVQLREDEIEEVRVNLALNPNCPADCLIFLANAASTEEQDLIDALSRNELLPLSAANILLLKVDGGSRAATRLKARLTEIREDSGYL